MTGGMELRVQNSSFEVISLSLESVTTASYDNHRVAKVNDHEVRLSIMTEAYHWHSHPDSDESFLRWKVVSTLISTIERSRSYQGR